MGEQVQVTVIATGVEEKVEDVVRYIQEFYMK